LTQESGDGRHLACLALNNLSIPTENKRVMALGPASKDVIGGLCKVIAEDKKDAYLCCICLMNLSFLEESITSILHYSPSPDGNSIHPLDNPDSLLRIIEKLLINSRLVPKPTVPSSVIATLAGRFLRNFIPSSAPSKPDTLRFACGLIRNLAKSEENAKLIAKTSIPEIAVQIILGATTPPATWTTNSLEDLARLIVHNLDQWPVSRNVLTQTGTRYSFEPILCTFNPNHLVALGRPPHHQCPTTQGDVEHKKIV
jgi:hypothetical protein